MSASMSISLAPTPQFEDDHMLDDVSFQSGPSDEWGNNGLEGGRTQDDMADEHGAEEEREGANDRREQDEEKSWFSKPDQKSSSYLSNNSFTGYLSQILPSRFTQTVCTTVGTDTRTESKADVTRVESSKITERSSHSRCYIENTESIRDRRDDRREKRDMGGDEHRDDENDNNDATYSVEEFTQISEITMDIGTVFAESKFVACTGLPTIEEAKRFDPTIAACTDNFSRKNVKAQCGTTGENAKNGSKDVIDFVFELVEDTFCVPLNRSKAEKKKAFMEAYQEESIKFARTNSLVDPWQTASKHSRSNRTPRRSGKSPSFKPTLKQTKEKKTSSSNKEEGGFLIVDKAPPPRKKISSKADEEKSLDWSKIMSFAEKQLENDGKSVISKETAFASVRNSISDRRSFFTSGEASVAASPDFEATADEPVATPTEPQDHSTTSSLSNSSSTNATAAISANTTNEAVQSMRDLSAMDSSSFEEPRRLLLTSLLLRLLLQLLPGVKKIRQENFKEKSSKAVMTTSRSHSEYANEGTFHKSLRYTTFFFCFFLWPAGIPRRRITVTPMLQKPQKPSLLKLVFEGDDQ